jgi:hypothetical protein
MESEQFCDGDKYRSAQDKRTPPDGFRSLNASPAPHKILAGPFGWIVVQRRHVHGGNNHCGRIAGLHAQQAMHAPVEHARSRSSRHHGLE